eukprot:CAMPEP_0175392048 /NCGR_PEP_ID=MMETSP0095-20121207/32223_1 /TAXON_ID=311494 /ORGANISM="Alexandrium monilatum, Strain CCMP3105" /LENGTH=581 /DNA_ID=CAMNT_0016690617 /DNA_START=341 /DNA_END=2087 /DNA_ORIENTATION=+
MALGDPKGLKLALQAAGQQRQPTQEKNGRARERDGAPLAGDSCSVVAPECRRAHLVSSQGRGRRPHGLRRRRFGVGHQRQVLEPAVKAVVLAERPTPGRHLQGVAEVCEEVIDVLDANGQAQEVLRQRPLLGRNGSVAHGTRHLAQTVDAPEGHGRFEDPARVKHPPGELHVACCEADDAAGARALRAVDPQALRVTPMGPGVGHVLDPWVLGQEGRDLHRILLGLLHAQEHGLDASQKEETLKRREGRALGVLQERHAMGEIRVTNANKPTSTVRMAREELRRGVDDNVDSQRQRLADDRGHHRAVHAEQHVVLVRERRERPEVRDPHQRVRGALGVDELRPRANRTADGVEVGGAHESHHDAAVHAVLREQPVHPSVDVLVDDDFVALPEEPGDGVQCRHARGEREGCCGLLQHGNMLLQRRPRGVPRSGVIIGAKLARRGLDEGRRLVDGSVGWVVGVLRATVKHDTLRGWPESVLEVGKVRPDWERRQVVVGAVSACLGEPDLAEVDLLADGATDTLEEGSIVEAHLGLAAAAAVPTELPQPPDGVLQAPGVHVLSVEFGDHGGPSVSEPHVRRVRS